MNMKASKLKIKKSLTGAKPVRMLLSFYERFRDFTSKKNDEFKEACADVCDYTTQQYFAI